MFSGFGGFGGDNKQPNDSKENQTYVLNLHLISIYS